VRRGRLLIGFGIAGLTAAAAAALWSPPSWLINLLPVLFPGCLYRVQTTAPVVALTIDDGPDPATTPLLLAELDRHEAGATFFLISERVRGHETLVQHLVTAGHELGNHLSRDEPSISLSPADFETDLLRAHRTLAQFGPVKWARPSSGWYSRPMIAIMRRHGYRCALGSVYPYDAALPSAEFASNFILRNAGPGAIVILHDGGQRGRRSVEVLRNVLPQLRRRGFQVVTLSEMLRRGATHRRVDLHCPLPHGRSRW
jgi:peptidoglycan-N-acetylglucosamine deacetylase